MFGHMVHLIWSHSSGSRGYLRHALTAQTFFFLKKEELFLKNIYRVGVPFPEKSLIRHCDFLIFMYLQ